MSSEPPILPGCTVLPPLLTAEEKRRKAERAERREAEAVKPGKAKARDRFAVLNGFVDAGMVGLTRAELAAWLVLYRDTRNGVARTSIGDIARRAGLSRRAVDGALVKLRRRGLLERTYKGGLNRGPNVYRVRAGPP